MSDKTNKPMDDSADEAREGTPATNHQRVCGAIKQLVEEVLALFPETPAEYSNYDGRNTALDVTFDLSSLEGGDSVIFNDLMSAVEVDTRVAEVLTADFDQAFVCMKSSARTQDSRESFGLAEALHVLADDDMIVSEPEFITVAEGYGSWDGGSW